MIFVKPFLRGQLHTVRRALDARRACPRQKGAGAVTGSRKTRFDANPRRPVACHHDKRPGRGELPVFGRGRPTKQQSDSASFAYSAEFESFVALAYPKVYWVSQRMCTTAEDPNDFVQDALIKVWNAWLKSADDNVWTIPYCITALKSVIFDARRRKKKTVPIADGVDVNLIEVSYDVELRNGIMDSRTQRLLDRLTERQRAVITAIVFDGYEPAKVAEMLGLDRQTVYDAKRVALRKLADLLSE